MKKILIISYHFPPFTAIASRRAEAYANNFIEHGIYPTIITHKWDKLGERGWSYHSKKKLTEISKKDNYTVVSIPRVKNCLQVVQEKIKNIPPLSFMFTLCMNLLGHFDMHILYSYYNFRKELKSHLKQNQYDFVLGIFSPNYHIRLLYELNKKIGIKYAVDFRDLYDNRIISNHFQPTLKERVYIGLYEGFWKKWLRNASFLTSVSEPLVKKVAEISRVPSYSILNGFEERLFTSIPALRTSKFTFSHIGKIYKEQNLQIVLSGLKAFLVDKDADQIVIQFVGLKEKIEEIKSFIPSDFLKFILRVDRSEALTLMKSSHILFYPAWTTIKGIYSGKIFEYLGSRNNILIAPGHDGVVDDLIKETKAGVIANSSEEVCQYLEEKYKEWQENGKLNYHGDPEKINKYTRESQVAKMASLIHGYLNK